MEKNSGFI